MAQRRRQLHRPRAGTTVVETAVVLPVFLLFVFAIFEFSHAQLVINMINDSCRNGARVGAVEGTTTSQVVTAINDVLKTVVPEDSMEIFVKDATVFDTGTPPETGSGIEALPDVELSNAEPRQMFAIRVRVHYNDIALVPMPFMKDAILDGQAFMRHE